MIAHGQGRDVVTARGLAPDQDVAIVEAVRDHETVILHVAVLGAEETPESGVADMPVIPLGAVIRAQRISGVILVD